MTLGSALLLALGSDQRRLLLIALYALPALMCLKNQWLMTSWNAWSVYGLPFAWTYWDWSSKKNGWDQVAWAEKLLLSALGALRSPLTCSALATAVPSTSAICSCLLVRATPCSPEKIISATSWHSGAGNSSSFFLLTGRSIVYSPTTRVVTLPSAYPADSGRSESSSDDATDASPADASPADCSSSADDSETTSADFFWFFLGLPLLEETTFLIASFTISAGLVVGWLVCLALITVVILLIQHIFKYLSIFNEMSLTVSRILYLKRLRVRRCWVGR